MRHFLIALSLVLLCGCSGSRFGTIEEIFQEDFKNAAEILVVRQISGSVARADFFVLASDSLWRRDFCCKAYIGREGVGKSIEGDGKTPLGTFKVTSAFGVKPCPGGLLPYRKLTPSIFACDEEGEFYNRIIDTASVHHICRGEDMFKTVPAYDYGLTLDYNAACIYPSGSNIFIHCFSGKKYTGGCIALPERKMRRLIRHASQKTIVVIK